MNPFRILLVDDDTEWSEGFTRKLKNFESEQQLGELGAVGCNRLEIRHVTNQDDADGALGEAGPRGYDLVLLDLDYPEHPGPAVVRQPDSEFQGMRWLPDLRRKLPHAAIVIITSYPYENSLEGAVKAIRDHHANDYVPKTTPFDHIAARIKIACQHAREMQKLDVLGKEYQSLGRSLSARVFAEDGLNLLSRVKGPIFAIANDISSGDTSAICAAPEKLRTLYRCLETDYLELIEVLYENQDVCGELDVVELIRDLLDLYERRIEAAGARVAPPPKSQSQKVLTYQSDLKVALHEIVSNAIEALDCSKKTPVGERLLTVSVQKQEEDTLIRIADNADGFSDDAIENLFGPVKIPRKDGRHRGIGLYIAKRMIRSISGDLIARNRDEGGAEVILSLRSLRSG